MEPVPIFAYVLKYLGKSDYYIHLLTVCPLSWLAVANKEYRTISVPVVHLILAKQYIINSSLSVHISNNINRLSEAVNFKICAGETS